MKLKSNAEELALIGQETDAEVTRGPVRYAKVEHGFDVKAADFVRDSYGIGRYGQLRRGNPLEFSTWLVPSTS